MSVRFQISNNMNLDIYDFDKVVQQWPIDFYQLGNGVFKSHLTQLISENIHLNEVYFNSRVKQEGHTIPGFWSFALTNEIPLNWRNYRVEAEDVIIYAPNSEINAVSNAGFEVEMLSVTEELLQSKLEERGYESLLTIMKSNPVFKIEQKSYQDVRSSIKRNVNTVLKDGVLEEQVLDALIDNLIEALAEGQPSNRMVSSKSRLAVLVKAETYIEKNIAEGVSVAQVAAHCEVSERTLLYAFKERFDVTTKLFISIIRLNHVYRLLRSSNGQKSIANISRQMGYWHMGQFHKDYKAFFGELPSHRLR